MSGMFQVAPALDFTRQVLAMFEAAQKKFDISDDVLHILGTPEGQEHIERMLIGLKKSATAATSEAARFSAPAFFNTRTGLYVSEEFITYIVSRAKVAEAKVLPMPHPLDVNGSASDADIRQILLPADHVFDGKTEFLPMLAALLNVQWRGQPGVLSNTGIPNVFYVCIGAEIFTVPVSWFLRANRWHIDAWPVTDDTWPPGHRFFSRS